jgi:tRNA dimethylallyltransferase
MPAQRLLVIVGPTASGKSALALALAGRLGGEIVSADAFAVYRGMDIGTAKPGEAELAAVPHHLISILEASQRCDVQRWFDLAEAAIAGIAARGRLPIVAGGTPLYVKALLEGLSAGAPRDEALRERLRQRYREEGGERMLAELARVDPVYARDRHANDERRLVRALEVHALTGRPYSSFHTTDGIRRTELSPFIIGLRWDRAELHRRINARVKAMIAAGLVDEVARVQAIASPEAMQAVGYKEVVGHLDRRHDLERAIELIKRNTRQLARHQETWYRRWSDIAWLPGDAPDLLERAEALVAKAFADATTPRPEDGAPGAGRPPAGG